MKISVKPLIISYIVIIVLMFVGLLTLGDTYSIYMVRVEPGNDVVNVDLEPEGVVEVADITMMENQVKVTIRAVAPGDTTVLTTYTMDKDNPGKYQSMMGSEITVTDRNIILNGNFDFGGNQYTLSGIALIFLATAVFFLRGFIIRRKKDFFSYRTILDLGLFLYFTMLTAVFGGVSVLYFARPELLSASLFFDYAGNALGLVVILTIPLLSIFAVFMALSNLRLIMKEGFRPVNLLGIFIGVFMILGALGCFYLLQYAPFLIDYSILGIFMYVAKTATAAAFLYVEIILLATVICLQMAARFKPSYNKDFIIILGCAIRKDGTLFPLIRGRVDKAIEFYKNQLEATGKKAIFVPSGGQGSDEIISEGEAMKRYLLEQGIEEEQNMAETESTTTLENMKFSQNLISKVKADAKVAFSTTNYHVFRGGMFAREAGMKASGMGSKTKWFFWPNAEVREFIGLVVNEIWVHIGVVFGLALISVIMANMGQILKMIL